MIKIKKLVAIALTLVMTVSLAACGTSNKQEAVKKKSTSEFVTIHYVMLGDKPKNGQLEKAMDKINVVLKQKVNANLQLDWVEWADWQTKYNLLLASGSSLDLITSGSDWLDLWPNAQKGAFKNLDELLPEYAPQTYSQVSKDQWAQTKYNGKIVTIPENQYTQWINHGFMYRGDWAKEFGITSPITSWDQLGSYLQKVKEKKPNVVPWEIPVQNAAEIAGLWFQSKTKNILIDAVPNYIYYGKSAEESYSVVSPFMDDTFLEYAKNMKTWGDAGYWREDALNFKGDPKSQLEAGKSGTYEHVTNSYINLTDEMERKQPGSDLKWFAASTESGNLLELNITHGCTSLGANSKNPERALMVYDLLRNDQEIYKLLNWGIEGVQYEITNGTKSFPKAYNPDKDAFYSDFWGGRMDKFEIPSNTVYKDYKTIYGSYDKIKKPYPYGRFVFDKTPVDAELSAIGDVYNKMIPAISLGKAGDPVKAVNDFRSQLKTAGYDKVLAELQKQMDAYKKLVETK